MPTIPKKETIKLRLPQIRVLKVLERGAALTRQKICEATGFSPIAGTITSALNGVRQGSSSGAARPGLLTLALVEKQEIDIDGVTEMVYIITKLGKQALAELDRQLPALRDKGISTNRRYKESSDG